MHGDLCWWQPDIRSLASSSGVVGICSATRCVISPAARQRDLQVRSGRGRNPARLELHVTDDGEGVPEELREHVFELILHHAVAWHGVGLYIARELCDANGARLELLGNAPGAFRIGE